LSSVCLTTNPRRITPGVSFCPARPAIVLQRQMATDSIEMLRSTPNPRSWVARGGQFQFMRRLAVGVVTALLVSAGLGLAGLGPGVGIAQAGAFHWCPGDPPPHYGNAHANPDWDMTVCHDYVFIGNQVEEGIPCTLPQFQWFQCPPGTTPAPQMVPVPNK
jgi:hypothetical protein